MHDAGVRGTRFNFVRACFAGLTISYFSIS